MDLLECAENNYITFNNKIFSNKGTAIGTSVAVAFVPYNILPWKGPQRPETHTSTAT
jgi:hypothetical protein